MSKTLIVVAALLSVIFANTITLPPFVSVTSLGPGVRNFIPAPVSNSAPVVKK